MLAEGERATGLQLPEDIETLLGDGISLSVDASRTSSRSAESPDPSQVPAGIRIQGDPAKIIPIIDKLKAAAGPDADMVKVASGDGLVAVGSTRRTSSTLLEKGTWRASPRSTTWCPRRTGPTGSLYVNFDAGDGWAEQLADLLSDGDAEARSNIAPLDALGVSGWSDGDVEHGLLRLTTD